MDLLLELGAVSPSPIAITKVGRDIARLPLDPRFARMLVEAKRHGVVREVAAIVAGLSIQDPRERPLEKRAQADTAHKRFADPTSDFLSLLGLWNHLEKKQRELSGSAFRRMCRAEFLNYLRVREWQDLYRQLVRAGKPLGLVPGDAKVDPDGIHRSLLSGLLSRIGLRDKEKRDYLGARQQRFVVFPGSGLAKKTPEAVMAAELVETSRLFARTVAAIDPAWAEPLAGDLAKRTYSEPHWEKKQGSGVAYERVTLFGLPIVVRRRVQLARIDPVEARELFLRNALVEGDWPYEIATQRALRVRPREPCAAARARRGGGADAAPRHPGRRRGGGRVLRPADPARRHRRPSLRDLVEEGAGRDPRPAHDDPGRPARRAGRAGCRAGRRPVPRPLGAGRAADAVALPLRARRRGRRSHRRGAARAARTAAARGLRPAGARAARGTRHGPAQEPAEGDPHATSCRPPTGRGGFSPSCRPRAPTTWPRRSRSRRCSRHPSARPLTLSSSADDFDLERLPAAPADDLRRRRRTRTPDRLVEGPRRAAGPARREVAGDRGAGRRSPAAGGSDRARRAHELGLRRAAPDAGVASRRSDRPRVPRPRRRGQVGRDPGVRHPRGAVRGAPARRPTDCWRSRSRVRSATSRSTSPEPRSCSSRRVRIRRPRRCSTTRCSPSSTTPRAIGRPFARAEFDALRVEVSAGLVEALFDAVSLTARVLGAAREADRGIREASNISLMAPLADARGAARRARASGLHPRHGGRSPAPRPGLPRGRSPTA